MIMYITTLIMTAETLECVLSCVSNSLAGLALLCFVFEHIP